MSITPWARADRRATGRIADVVFVVFHEGPLADGIAMSASTFGAPSPEAVGRCDVTKIEDPSWLSGWRSGGIRNVAETQLGADLATLDRADRCHLVRATIADPPDLTYLQAAWAIARWLVARGATIVLDAYSITFHTAAKVKAQDPAGPFELARDVAIISEHEPSASRLGHVVHTRGLGKLARPDLIALVDPSRADEAADVLRALAGALADGFMPRHAGERAPAGVAVPPQVSLHPLPEGSLADSLHLNNDAWLVELDVDRSLN
ncbi:hypothetical protein L6R52_33380 [Myxococcota bacterium]|nr:hypothetical protein [Myxococcota bacterium]